MYILEHLDLFMCMQSCWSNICVLYYPGLYTHKEQISFCTYVPDFIFSLSFSACYHRLLNEIHHEIASQSPVSRRLLLKTEGRVSSEIYSDTAEAWL